MKDKKSNSVRVAVRIRPQSTYERSQNLPTCLAVTPGQPQLTMGSDKVFTFDYVFDQIASQNIVYEKCVQKLVEGAFEGYNATVLAYGQTGSGKTYTIGTGFENDLSNHGIIPRAAHHLFRGIEERRQTAQKAGKVTPSFEVSAQFIELYNEELIDLLTRDRDGSSSIKIQEDPVRHEISLLGVSSRVVTSPEDIFAALKAGAQNRTTAATNMNKQSSRSHAIFTVNIKQTRVETIGDENSDQHTTVDDDTNEEECANDANIETELQILQAKFHFVDLAGSERLNRTGATGDRAKESISINSGLLALGNVISALGSAKGRVGRVHVPYRDSKLTRLLQDSLGGNSRTFMIACASPNEVDFNETLSALNYANRAKNIKNKVVANQNKSSTLITELRIKIQVLEAELLEWRTGTKRRSTEHKVNAVHPGGNTIGQLFGGLMRLDEEEEEDADDEEEPEEMEHERICVDLDNLQEGIESKEHLMAKYERELNIVRQEMERRVEEGEKERKRMKEKYDRQMEEKSLRKLEEAEKECKRLHEKYNRQMEEKTRLARELEQMKKQKVDLVKRQKEENKRIRDLVFLNNKQMASYTRVIRQQENKINKLERECAQKTESLRRKLEEMHKLKKKDRRRTMFESNSARKPLAPINEQVTPNKHVERLNTTYLVSTPDCCSQNSNEEKQEHLLGELPEDKESNYKLRPLLEGCQLKGPMS